jgi:hypothetical protein
MSSFELSAAMPQREVALGERQLDDRLLIALALAWGAGLVNVEAAIEHAPVFGAFAGFFALIAAAQVCWGVAVYRSASRRLLITGATASLAVAALWIASRVILTTGTLGHAATPALFFCRLTAGGLGVATGTGSGTLGSLGVLDLIAVGDEILLALMVVLHLRPGVPGLLAGGCRRLVTGLALSFILLSCIGLVLAAHSHH